ncbi:MAG: pyridoxal-5-phosphate-dependent protein subunit beta, partial [bacterium]
LYGSRKREMLEKYGEFTPAEARRIHLASLTEQKIDNMLELRYYDALRIHNLKYYTWIEQQQKRLEDLNAQWYDKNYWQAIRGMLPLIDGLIEEFNAEILKL